jgi:cytochrome c peroxidase
MSRRGGRLALAPLALTLACAAEPEVAPGPLTRWIAPAGFPLLEGATGTPTEDATREARAQLGKRLFFDKRLSRSNAVACGTCHRPALAFAQPTAVSTGIDGRRGVRNAPSLVNLAWTRHLFWDGRVSTLEEQAGLPIENPDEMGLSLGEAVRRLEADGSYRQAFATAYAGPPSEERLRGALASFVSTLVSGQTPYDRFLRGDESALDAVARRGLKLFFSDRAACFHCHPAGPLTNDGFFDNGTFVAGGDPGRAAITGRAGDLGKFRVPGLRNVAVTAPYMHDGSVATLEEVVEQYARGGRGDPHTDAVIAPLALTGEEKADLLAFLRALTDERFLSDPRFRD